MGRVSTKKLPNLTDAWKKIYFESEEVLARSIDEYVAGQSFTDFLEQMGSQYLSFYKATNQNMDRFFANNPMPSKKDIARVAELVVAVEEKVDNLESDLSANMAALAVNLIKLVDFQVVLKDELLALRQDVHAIQSQILLMQAKKDETMATLKENLAAEVPARRRNKGKPGDLLEEEKKPILPKEDNKNAPAEPPARQPRRSKKASDKI